VDRLKALGNAVVPQITEWIGRRIVEAETRAERAWGTKGKDRKEEKYER
jgi:hypothetical protein